MRTKTLLITAALSLAGVATSMAQVYSVNAVGYINLTLQPNFNLVANQLNRTPDNKLNNVLPGLPSGTQVLKFSNSLNNYVGPEVTDGTAWFTPEGNPGSMTANPGEAIFVNNPEATPITVTFVGEVPQGALTVALPSGFSMVASAVPQAVPLVAANGFPQIDGNQYITFNAAGQKFNDPLINAGGAWFDALGNPVTVAPAVGQAFFYGNQEAATAWNRNFTVN